MQINKVLIEVIVNNNTHTQQSYKFFESNMYGSNDLIFYKVYSSFEISSFFRRTLVTSN